MTGTPSPDAIAGMAHITAAARSHLLIEAAGVFWLLAEVAILFAVREARRTLSGRPARDWRPRLALWISITAVPLLLLLLHAWTLTRIDWLDAPIKPESAAQRLTFHVHRHLAVWSLFIFGWVALETLIVAEGLRAYRHFGALCRRMLTPLRTAALAGLVAALAIEGAAQAASPQGPVMTALLEAEAALQPYRNAVYLYLRVAGVVWIAVEWVAAIALWRGQALLGRVARELAPHA
ncbi:MAG: hypothetical protein RLZZ303_24 [Candidatus Hydrogenedentota bacterium]|jgi:heme/copper-type cytochrome/quinol oxidase subunit 2